MIAFARHGLLLVLLFGSFAVFAQDKTEQEQIIQRRIETIAEQLGEGDEALDYNTLLDELLIFSENPVNLNTAKYEELLALPILDEIAVANLIQHIEKHGKLLNIYELQSVNGFSNELIHQLEPFIRISDNPEAMTFSFKEMMKEGEHELVFRYQQVLNEQVGYSPIEDSVLAENPNRRYLGSPQKYWARYRFRYSNKVSWGLTMEKDAGEEFFKGSMKQGFDFYSGHLFIQNMGVVKQAALGDFQAQFGQGLVFWSGLAFGKSSDGVSIKRNPQGLRPYTSVDENRFLRGGGATLQFGNFEVTAFGSYKMIDGNITVSNDTLSEQEETVSSIFSSGFHRTPGELQDRQSIAEAVYGGNVSYRNKRLSVGVTAVGYQFSKPIQRSNNLYNIFEFSGTQNSNFGVDYSYIFRNFHFFGEFGLSQNLGFATTHGIYMTVDPRVTLTVMVRHFEPKYQALYANAVTENSRMNNETGYYLGFNITPFKSWYVRGFFDVFRFPWLRFQTNGLSFGYETIGQLGYRPSRNLEIYFRFRQKNRQLNEPASVSEAAIRGIEDELRSYYRLNLQYSLSKEIKLRSRVEYSRYRRGDREVEQGFMMYQDVIYSPTSFPLSFSARLAYFETESFNARIFAFENDVLYAYSFPSYYYRGVRSYLTLRYNIYKGIDAWFRIANTFFANRDHVGSGLEETPSNNRTDIKVQLRFRF